MHVAKCAIAERVSASPRRIRTARSGRRLSSGEEAVRFFERSAGSCRARPSARPLLSATWLHWALRLRLATAKSTVQCAAGVHTSSYARETRVGHARTARSATYVAGTVGVALARRDGLSLEDGAALESTISAAAGASGSKAATRFAVIVYSALRRRRHGIAPSYHADAQTRVPTRRWRRCAWRWRTASDQAALTVLAWPRRWSAHAGAGQRGVDRVEPAPSHASKMVGRAGGFGPSARADRPPRRPPRQVGEHLRGGAAAQRGVDRVEHAAERRRLPARADGHGHLVLAAEQRGDLARQHSPPSVLPRRAAQTSAA